MPNIHLFRGSTDCSSLSSVIWNNVFGFWKKKKAELQVKAIQFLSLRTVWNHSVHSLIQPICTSNNISYANLREKCKTLSFTCYQHLQGYWMLLKRYYSTVGLLRPTNPVLQVRGKQVCLVLTSTNVAWFESFYSSFQKRDSKYIITTHIE